MHTKFSEYLLNEASGRHYALYLYKGKKRISATSKDIENLLSSDGKAVFSDRGRFFGLLNKYIKDRNQMVTFIDTYFWLDDGEIDADDLVTMNGDWLRFDIVKGKVPLYCIKVSEYDNISVVFVEY